MKNIEVYKCEYCDNIYKSEEYLGNHEKGCLSNPKNRSCRTCTWAWDVFYQNDHPCEVNVRKRFDEAFKIRCSQWIWREAIKNYNYSDISKLVVKELPLHKVKFVRKVLLTYRNNHTKQSIKLLIIESLQKCRDFLVKV